MGCRESVLVAMVEPLDYSIWCAMGRARPLFIRENLRTQNNSAIHVVFTRYRCDLHYGAISSRFPLSVALYMFVHMIPVRTAAPVESYRYEFYTNMTVPVATSSYFVLHRILLLASLCQWVCCMAHRIHKIFKSSPLPSFFPERNSVEYHV